MMNALTVRLTVGRVRSLVPSNDTPRPSTVEPHRDDKAQEVVGRGAPVRYVVLLPQSADLAESITQESVSGNVRAGRQKEN